jgi:hypothetical protein
MTDQRTNHKDLLSTARLPGWLTPVVAAFIGSLLLSLTARLGSTLNRDGMLYVRTSQAFLEGGFDAAKELFNWPFLPILMAVVSKVTGLDLENAGHLLNALFMAGACALMVACVSRKQPEVAWSVCLVTLAIPGLNEYRSELLREFGCWFFIMLAFWLALRWSERPRWLTALAVQITLAASALFRPEALTFFPALIGWQVFDAPREEKWQRLLMLGGLPFAGGVLLLALYLGGHLPGGSRLSGELARISSARFDAKAQTLAATLVEYARGQARTILLFGSLALIPIKLIQKIGPFIVPLAFLFFTKQFRPSLSRYPLFSWGIAAHLLVLMIFVIDLQFLAGRYVGLVLLLAAPFIGLGFWLMIQRHPRWRYAFIATALLMTIANVVSLGHGKTHYVEAGSWLKAQATESSRVYMEAGRAAHYAGWHTIKLAPRDRRNELLVDIRQGKYDLLVLEISRKDPPVEDWLNSAGLHVLKRFDHPNKDAVIIAAPNDPQTGKAGPQAIEPSVQPAKVSR